MVHQKNRRALRMMNVKHDTIDFEDVLRRVREIADTEKTEVVTTISQKRVAHVEDFTEYGFSTLGKTVGFPARFVMELAQSNKPLAEDIVRDRVSNYFHNRRRPFYIRRFLDKICGVVSDKYSYFDDNQVVDILEGSPLAEMGFQNAIITPERFHLRAIEADKPFSVTGDSSDLFFAYFIDNSMVGQSSFKVQLGIYRLACTNGMILPVKEFIICRQIHRGQKDIAAEFNESIAFLAQKRDAIKEMISNMTAEQATIETIQEEFRRDYIAKKLNLNQKETEKVIELYSTVYDGHTKWGMANAITEFARDLTDINRRESLERAAFKAA